MGKMRFIPDIVYGIGKDLANRSLKSYIYCNAIYKEKS